LRGGAGLPLETARVCAFWDLFEMGAAHGSSRREAWAACEPAAARGEPFKLHGVARRGGGGGAASPRRFTLKFRPALPEPDGAAQCGLALPPCGRPYFFVELDLDSAPTTPRGADAGWPGGARWGAPRAGADVGFGCGAGGGDGRGGGPDGGAAALCASPARSDPGCALASATSMPFPGLEVGKLLGRGAFGFVYCGTYQGATVAVKVPRPAAVASLQVRLAVLQSAWCAGGSSRAAAAGAAPCRRWQGRPVRASRPAEEQGADGVGAPRRSSRTTPTRARKTGCPWRRTLRPG